MLELARHLGIGGLQASAMPRRKSARCGAGPALPLCTATNATFRETAIAEGRFFCRPAAIRFRAGLVPGAPERKFLDEPGRVQLGGLMAGGHQPRTRPMKEVCFGLTGPHRSGFRWVFEPGGGEAWSALPASCSGRARRDQGHAAGANDTGTQYRFADPTPPDEAQ